MFAEYPLLDAVITVIQSGLKKIADQVYVFAG
jgi:hypothetical protein